MEADDTRVFLVRRKTPPLHSFLAFAGSSEDILNSLARRHQATPPPDGQRNQVLGVTNKEIFASFTVEDWEIVETPAKRSDFVVKMLNDDWGTATFDADGKARVSTLLNLM